MNNAERILAELDLQLDATVELTLYGRAALSLGFPSPPEEFGQSTDVDAILAMGQAEELLAETNFWHAIEETNEALADSGLYVSHLFAENQVVLTATWKKSRVPISGPWHRLRVLRLGDEDLLLSKLMRDDPHDREDALFIARTAGLAARDVERLLLQAIVPPIPEIAEQFEAASKRLLQVLT